MHLIDSNFRAIFSAVFSCSFLDYALFIWISIKCIGLSGLWPWPFPFVLILRTKFVGILNLTQTFFVSFCYLRYVLKAHELILSLSDFTTNDIGEWPYDCNAIAFHKWANNWTDITFTKAHWVIRTFRDFSQ